MPFFLYLVSFVCPDSLRFQTRLLIWREYRPLYLEYTKRSIFALLHSLFILEGAFVTIPLIVLILALLNVFYFPKLPLYDYINFISISTKKAQDTISNSIGNSSQLIGVSFVVIGFFFETAKDKTHRTLRELFVVTWVYPVLSLSLTVVAYHIVANAFIDTIREERAIINLGILSSYLMVALILSVVLLFRKIIKMYSSEALSELSSNALINSAKNRLTQELFLLKGAEIYINEMQRLGLTAKYFFFSVDTTRFRLAVLQNEHLREIYDIRFRSISRVYSKFREANPGFNMPDVKFRPLKLQDKVREDTIFELPRHDFFTEGRINTLVRAVKLVKPKTRQSDFSVEKANLAGRLKKSVASNDLASVERQLSDIAELYKLVDNHR